MICILAPIFTNVVFPWAVVLLALPIRGAPSLWPVQAFALTALFDVALFNQMLLDETPEEGVDRPRVEAWLVRAESLSRAESASSLGVHESRAEPEARIL